MHGYVHASFHPSVHPSVQTGSVNNFSRVQGEVYEKKQFSPSLPIVFNSFWP